MCWRGACSFCPLQEQNDYLKKHGLWEQVLAVPGFLQELRDNTKAHKRGISNEQVRIVVAVDTEKQMARYYTSVWCHFTFLPTSRGYI